MRIIIALLVLLLAVPVYGSMHKTPKQNKSTIKNYDAYKIWYDKRAAQNLKINKQKQNWSRNSKAYRRNPEPSNPVPPARP